jgi:ABC-2 type transport system ATP-binding protein
VTIVGRGFSERILALLRAWPEVASVEWQNNHLFIEAPGAVDVAPLVSLIVNAGAEVEEVRKESASLEDVFLTLMAEGEP